MTQTDEKELVLGNKQLISLFFVVVALCGVFFAMGYMIGRNTSKPVTASLDAPPATAPASGLPATQESEPPRETAVDSPASSPPSVSAAPVSTAPASNTPVETHPAAPEPAAATPPQAGAAAPSRSVAHEATVVPETGATYLQVTALRRNDAESLVKTLREQSFPALVAESSKPDLFRVLVGPYHQALDVADAKAKLKALGFANAFVQK